MKLSELLVGNSAVVKKIDAISSLKHRLYSFGIIKGATITIEAISMAKNTLEINVDDTLIAIRMEEASIIEVDKI